MYNEKRLKEIIDDTKRTHRDIQIDKLFDPNPIDKTYNEMFIEEIRDHLSTCINRNTFINREWFMNPDEFSDIPTCNCKTHIEKEDDFREFLKVLYSMYRRYDYFDVGFILTQNIINAGK